MRKALIFVALLTLVACQGTSDRSRPRDPAAVADSNAAALASLTARIDTTPCVFGIGVDQEPEIDPAGRVTPRYPESLRVAGIEGHVRLLFVVNKDGRVDSATVKVLESDHRYFIPPARAALLRSHFLPAMKNGAPTRCWTRQSFDFALTR